ncbi:MAG: T9SS type A sorting domain-containing protein [Flavobacteriales bacterium]|nr:T9SS type A sorting domain-containing protein [Flavobacteriales bacterium]
MKRYLTKAILSATTIGTSMAMEMHMDLHGLVSNAHVIVTATCTDVRAQADPARPGIVGTVAWFDAVETIRENVPGTAPRNGQLELHYLGGSADGINLHFCGMPTFTAGERYLLFLLNDGTRYMTPIVGASQGQFIIRTTPDGGTTYAVNTGGHAVLGIDGNTLIMSRCLIDPGTHEHGTCSHGEDDGLDSDLSDDMHLYEGEFMPLGELTRTIQEHHFDRPSLLDWTNNTEPMPALTFERSGDHQEGKEAAGDPKALGACKYQDVYISIKKNDDVPGFANWAVLDLYARDIYDKHINIFTNTPGSSNGTWGANNGKNEILGWQSSSTLDQAYGYTWGASALGVCITYSVNGTACSRIKEADIAFNPAYSWTTDWNTAAQSNIVDYRSIIMHETGHAWGYQVGANYPESYDYGQPSVMHGYYGGAVWENARELHAKDAQVIRNKYADQATVNVVTDLGAETYRALSGSGLQNSYASPTMVSSGGQITIHRITAENNSTTQQNNVRLRFYLSTDRSLGSSDHLVAMHSLGNMAAISRSVNSYTLNTVGVPPGSYYIGVKISRNGSSYSTDDRSANDVSWTTFKVNVTTNVGIEEEHTADPLRVFPNPTTGNVLLQLPPDIRPKQLLLMDMTGRLIEEHRLTGGGNEAPIEFMIDHPKGIYLLQMIDAEGRRFTSRVVKE